MHRRLFNLMAVLSLLSALVVVLLWVRSTCWASDLIEKRWRDQHIYLASTAGWLILENTPDHSDDRTELAWHRRPGPLRLSLWNDSTNVCNSLRFAQKGSFIVLGMHCWLASMLSLPLPALWLLNRTRKHRPLHCCTNCHYDLRASTGRCPECGEPIAPSTGEASSTRVESVKS